MSGSRVLDGIAGTKAGRADKAPGHWVLAQAGKRVLRPGGVELTDALLAQLDIQAKDTVIELAPGLGHTAVKVLARHPMTYLGVDREPVVVHDLQRRLGADNVRFIEGRAEDTGLPGETTSVLFGEAMLSMQCNSHRKQIVEEAWRVLKRGGRYGIHELCVSSDVSGACHRAIQAELAAAIHHGVHLLTVEEWRDLLESAGFNVKFQQTAPMRLLEPGRILRDEGLKRALCFGFNVLTDSCVRQRVLSMRRVFRRHRDTLQAIGMVCHKEY
jgi:ubiquinone/menaquinone biosynthesis C-methylase UbiE